MNNKNRSSGIIHGDKNKLSEIKDLLGKFIGDEITFNQFTGIMGKDNALRFFNRNSLLNRRKKFFKGEDKRGRKSAKEIRMPLDKFIRFLGTLANDREIKFDLEKFKGALVYCMNIGYIDKL